MGAQDNTLRSQALTDIAAALTAVNIFEEITDAPKGPEEVQVFPAAYYTGGDGDRENADTSFTLFRHSALFLVFLYVHEKETQGSIGAISGLSAKLEKAIQLTLDQIDVYTRGTFKTNGYLMHASRVETDEAALRISGSPVAMAVITLAATFPPKNA